MDSNVRKNSQDTISPMSLLHLHTCPRGHLTVWPMCPACIVIDRPKTMEKKRRPHTDDERKRHALAVAARLLAKADSLAKAGR